MMDLIKIIKERGIIAILLFCLLISNMQISAKQQDKIQYDMPVNLKEIGVENPVNNHGSKTPHICKFEVTVAIIDCGINIEEFTKYFDESRISKSSIDMLTGYLGVHSMKDAPSSHGTAVASLIAKGTPDNVKLLIIKAADDNVFADGIVNKSVDYAIDAGADIINISENGIHEGTQTDLMAKEYEWSAFKRAQERGIPIICSAGNNGRFFGSESVDYNFPASIDLSNVIVVSSLWKPGENTFELSDNSNYGSFIDFTAVGEKIDCVYSDSKYKPFEITQMYGTSFAAPAITCAYAWIKTWHLFRNEDLKDQTSDIITQELIQTCTLTADRYRYGHGMPNIHMYVDAVIRSSKTYQKKAKSSPVTTTKTQKRKIKK